MPSFRSAHFRLPPRSQYRGLFTDRRCPGAEASWPVRHGKVPISRYLALLATVLILAVAEGPPAYAASTGTGPPFVVAPTQGPPGTSIRLYSFKPCPPPKNAPAPTVDVGIPFNVSTGGGRRGQGTAWPINSQGYWTGSIPTYRDIPRGSYPIVAQCYANNINNQSGESPYYSYPLGTFKVATGNPPEQVLLDQAPPANCSVSISGSISPAGCEGRRIVSFGADVYQASHIVIRVFGVENSYPYTAQDATNQDSAARSLAATIDNQYTVESAKTAVVSWLGYDAPFLAKPQSFISSDQAQAGGKALSDFILRLRSINESPTGVTFTIIGHSYGSTVAAWAVRDSNGLLAGDNLVFVGSPGVDVSSASALDVARVFVGENPNDLVPRTATNSVDRQPLADLASIPVLNNAFGGLLGFAAGVGHNIDPATFAFLSGTSPGQTARRFGTDGECGHQYFATVPPDHPDQRTFYTQSLDNMAAIAEGDYGSVTYGHRPPGLLAVGPPSTIPHVPTVNVEFEDDCASLNDRLLAQAGTWTKDAAISAIQGLAKITASLGRKVGDLTHTVIQMATPPIEQLGQTVQAGVQTVEAGAQTILQNLPRPPIPIPPLPSFSINVNISLPSFAARDRAFQQANNRASQNFGRGVLLATGRHAVGRHGITKLTLTFTKAGRRLLANKAAVRLQATVQLQLRGRTLGTASGTKSVRLHH